MSRTTTLDMQIQAMRDTIAATALDAAQSRGVRHAGDAFLLYALYRDEGLTGRMLRGRGVESGEVRRLMGDIPNRPLESDGKPVLDESSRRILKHANDTVEILRHVQRDGRVAALLAAHGIGLPALQPTQEQVMAASRTGILLAQSASPYADRRVGVDYLAYTRLMLEAAMNEEK